MSGRCAGCGTPIPPSRGGSPRKWCSERCRKASYGDPCMDCGARTAFGAERARVPEPRCTPCSVVHRTHWTKPAILAAIDEWVGLYGEPPAVPDWNPYHAVRLGDLKRAQRFKRAGGRWPGFMTVVDRFGSWNAGIRAAGYEPRPAHGGGGNVERRRAIRAKAAA